MNLDRDYIIAILLKKVSEIELSQQEEDLLQQWLEEDEKHRHLLLELQNDEIKAKHLKVLDEIPVESDWDFFSQKNSTKKTYRLRRFIPWAAAVLFIPLFYIVQTFIARRDTVKSEFVAESTDTHFDVRPASNNAELILDNGTRIVLDETMASQKIKNLELDLNDNVLQLKSPIGDKSGEILWSTISVPKGAYYTIVLEDKTKVWLNANSKLIFPSRFTDVSRKVKIEGEAFFEVSHEPERPFFVEAKGMDIKVLGTEFNVNAYTDRVRTTLSSGSVQLQSNEEIVRLRPGQYAQRSAQHLVVGNADLSKELAWKNGEFFFRKDNIVDIAYELSRWYDLEVKFVGNIDLKKLYSGTISRKSTLAKVLEVLKFGGDFDFEIQEKVLRIKEKQL